MLQPQRLFRGGSDLTPRLGADVLIDRTTGLLRTDRGISLFDDPGRVTRFGGAYPGDLMINAQSCARLIFPDGFDERAALETPLKGWLSAQVEMKDGKRYSVYFSDPVRLAQDLDENAQLGKPYFAEPGLIVLPEVTVEAAEESVHALCEQGFFAQLRADQGSQRAAI